MRSLEEILRTCCDYLNSRNVEYVIVGGFAVIAHGRPRATSDIDIIIQMKSDAVRAFASYLKDNGFFSDPSEAMTLIGEGAHFSATDKGSLFRLDIKGVCGEMDLRTLKNRQPIDYHGIRMFMASPEDTIANKLYFGSPQDLLDAEAVYIRQLPGLDIPYLEKTCAGMKLAGELKKMRARVDKGLRARAGNGRI